MSRSGLPPIDELRRRLTACEGEELASLLAALAADPRAGAQALLQAHERRRAREDAEAARLDALMTMQRELHGAGVAVVAGIDEVGRGALAGPVTAGAVVLDAACVIPGLDDSKRIPRARRAVVAREVRARAVAVSVAHAWPEEIDALGIGEAVRLAWRRALAGLGREVDHVLIDGNDATVGVPATAVVKGDASCACIAAASVLAKEERDALMREEIAAAHPGYGFEVNVGYGTAEHLEAIARMGASPVHRRSFAPCCGQERLFGE